MNDYLNGCDVLGAGYQGTAADYKTNPTGPLSPAQLADLDRVITSDEQAAVTAWQSGEAEQQLTAVRQGGGPRSETVTVTSKGTTIAAKKSPLAVKAPAPTSSKAAVPWWAWLLVIGGGLVVIGGATYAVKRAVA